MKANRIVDHMELFSENTSPLYPLFSPRTVAVIGATEREQSVGRTIMTNMQAWGEKGVLLPVNPKHDRIFDRSCISSVLDYPHQIDLAVIAVPARKVPEVMESCAQKKIPAVIIISAGFKELGPEGKLLEDKTMAIARAGNVRVLGPNCLGIINPWNDLNASFASGKALPGSIAFISQSGALCSAVLDWGEERKVGFSAFVSIGDMADIHWGDLIEYFGGDPNTHSIIMYVETVGDPSSFLSAAREVSTEKPIAVIKPGRTKEAARAALSHTGALVGSDAVFDAACEWGGVLRIDSLSQLFETAEALAWQPRPPGPRLAIVTNAGGPSVLATDAAIASGALLSELSNETKDRLRSLLPAASGVENPVDILGDADAKRYEVAAEVVMRDSSVDGLLAILTPQDMTDATQSSEAIINVASCFKKPVLTSWMGGEAVEAGRMLLSQGHIPCFGYPDDAAKCFGVMWRQVKLIDDFRRSPRSHSYPSLEESQRRKRLASEILRAAKSTGNNIVSEKESKRILRLYKVPIIEALYAGTEQEAADLAERVGFPVVVKVDSATVTHKMEVGGVFLNIRSRVDAAKAFQAIRSNVVHACGELAFGGVTIQKMIEPGIDVVIGSSTDPQFGPVILFGAGGSFVELLDDCAIGLPPLHAGTARRIIEKTKIYRAFSDFRRFPAIPMAPLEDLLIGLSELVLELPEVMQCDMNPIRVSARGIVCLDARLIIGEDNTRSASYEYLQDYASVVDLHGEHVVLRPIRSEDASELLRFHERISDNSLYAQALTHPLFSKHIVVNQLLRICSSHGKKRIAFVAEKSEKEIVGIVQLVCLQSGKWDFWIAAEEDFDLVKVLIDKIVAVAQAKHLGHLRALVYPNSFVQKLLVQVGFTEVSSSPEQCCLQLVKP